LQDSELTKKEDNPWSKHYRVTKVLGKENCELPSGLKGRPTRRHIDDLKKHDPGDAIIEDCKMNDEAIE